MMKVELKPNERRLQTKCRETISQMHYALGNSCLSPKERELKEIELAQFILEVRK
jgi:hypothetical protein